MFPSLLPYTLRLKPKLCIKLAPPPKKDLEKEKKIATNPWPMVVVVVVVVVLSSGGWVKIKVKRSHTSTYQIHKSCVDLTRRSRCNPLPRAAATGRVSMSTRPDPESSGAVEIAARRRPRCLHSHLLCHACSILVARSLCRGASLGRVAIRGPSTVEASTFSFFFFLRLFFRHLKKERPITPHPKTNF